MRCDCCIHNSVCALVGAIPEYSDCQEFIDINCFIKLPCKIGEKIFAIVEKKKANKDETYRYIQSYYLTYSNIERVIKNFGKTIFLTKDDAEVALAKINCDSQSDDVYGSDAEFDRYLGGLYYSYVD